MKINVQEPMFNTGSTVEGLQRCPDCHKLPDLTIEDKGFDKENFIFECKRHGHMAMGDTIEMVTAHWNIYTMAFRREVA